MLPLEGLRRLAPLAAVCLAAGCGGGHSPAPQGVGREVAAAVRLCDPGEGGSLEMARVCMQRRLLAIVSSGGATASELPLIDSAAEGEGGFLAENCHVL